MKYLPVFLLVAFLLHLPLNTSAAQSCQYVVTADQAPLYNAPLPFVSQQIDLLPQNGTYPVLTQSGDVLYLDTPFLIEVAEGVEGWVSLGQGRLDGDCSELPIDMTPATEYPTVCTFTLAGEATTQSVFAVIGFEDDQYLLWVDHAKSDWIDAEAGTRGGACTAPATAKALDNARVWFEPDVTSASMTAVLPFNTPVTVMAGPVRGPIRFDSSVEGDWYRVSDRNGVLGWVWSERLQFDDAVLTTR